MANTGTIKIFVIEDDAFFGRIIQKALESENSSYEISLFQSGQEFFNRIHEPHDIVTIDYNLPNENGIDILKKVLSYNVNTAAIIVSGQEKAEVVVEAYKTGAKDYVIKNENAIPELKKSIAKIIPDIQLRKEVELLREQVINRDKYYKIIGESPAIMQVLSLIQKVEKTGMMVMVTGESGTGKELVAKALHYNSPRKSKPFIPVNLAAIPEDLIESELFGHEKGAFTGAVSRRIGKFEEANEGTIFLDEIGEMDMGLQTKLLRVLQENKITRLGSNKEIKLEVRVIAATNKQLSQRVKEGKFREDLYYRLQGFLIHLPPLRERGNDVIILANFFLNEFCTKNKMAKKTLSEESMRALLEHNWPGNIRELKSCIERAVLISGESQTISPGAIIMSETIL
jgi:two-component system, NtrC family, response regulator AtoC